MKHPHKPVPRYDAAHHEDHAHEPAQPAHDPSPAEKAEKEPSPSERAQALLSSMTDAQRHNAPITNWHLSELANLVNRVS